MKPAQGTVGKKTMRTIKKMMRKKEQARATLQGKHSWHNISVNKRIFAGMRVKKNLTRTFGGKPTYF